MSSRTEPNERGIIMVRSLLFLIAVALIALTSACTPEDPFLPRAMIDTTVKNPAFLRIVHAAAGAPAARTMLGGKLFRFELGYLDFRTDLNEAKYYPADTASHVLEFIGGGTTLASTNISMEPGAFYSAYLHGRSPAYRILVTRDTVEAPAAFDQLRVRVVNLAPDAPPVDITFSTSPGDPAARGLAYGSARAYSPRGAADLEKPGVVVSESGTGDTLLSYPAGIMSLFGKATMTLVVSGIARPSGTEPMLSFAAFVESYVDPDDGLNGLSPIRLSLAAIRLINIVTSANQYEPLDLALYDREFEIKYPGQNDGYRRNYPGQAAVKKVPSLVYPEHKPQGYFLQKTAEKTEWRYRIERSTEPFFNNVTQTPISNPDTLRTEPNLRYTVVVFGPDTNLKVGTVELNDNVDLPVDGQARLRFFHGAHGSLKSQMLRLRAGSGQSPLQSYGQPTTKDMTFDVPPGLVTLEVVDESGAVIASSQHTLEGRVAYTVFFAPLADGSGWIIRPVADLVER
jgi:hypothetical protein